MGKAKLTSAQRAAMLVMSLEDEQAVKLLEHMSQGAVMKLREAAEDLDAASVGPREKRGALLDFLRRQQRSAFFLGDAGARFQRALARARASRAANGASTGEIQPEGEEEGEADKSEDDEEGRSELDEAFEFLRSVPEEDLAKTLAQESLACNVVLLSVLTGERAGKLLNMMQPERREKVVERLVEVEQVPDEVVDDLVSGFSEKLQNARKSSRMVTAEERIEELASMIANLERDSQERILSSLREKDPDTADKIEKRIFAFQDLAKVEKKSLQQLLSRIEPGTIALAIKGTPEELQDLIFSNLSQRVREQTR